MLSRVLRKYKENEKVDRVVIEENKERQQQEKDRQFQMGFALKNVCGRGDSFYGQDLSNVLLEALKRYGYEYEKLNLDKVDLAILSRANSSMNQRPQETSQLLEYVDSSNNPIEIYNKLTDSVKEKAIQEAASYQYTPEAADRFVPSDILSEFQKVIQEKDKEEKGIQ